MNGKKFATGIVCALAFGGIIANTCVFATNDNKLRDALDNEKYERLQADDQLDAAIDEAKTTLQGALNTAVTNLQSSINTLKSDLEYADAENAENLHDAIVLLEKEIDSVNRNLQQWVYEEYTEYSDFLEETDEIYTEIDKLGAALEEIGGYVTSVLYTLSENGSITGAINSNATAIAALQAQLAQVKASYASLEKLAQETEKLETKILYNAANIGQNANHIAQNAANIFEIQKAMADFNDLYTTVVKEYWTAQIFDLYYNRFPFTMAVKVSNAEDDFPGDISLIEEWNDVVESNYYSEMPIWAERAQTRIILAKSPEEAIDFGVNYLAKLSAYSFEFDFNLKRLALEHYIEGDVNLNSSLEVIDSGVSKCKDKLDLAPNGEADTLVDMIYDVSFNSYTLDPSFVEYVPGLCPIIDSSIYNIDASENVEYYEGLLDRLLLGRKIADEYVDIKDARDAALTNIGTYSFLPDADSNRASGDDGFAADETYKGKVNDAAKLSDFIKDSLGEGKDLGDTSSTIGDVEDTSDDIIEEIELVDYRASKYNDLLDYAYHGTTGVKKVVDDELASPLTTEHDYYVNEIKTISKFTTGDDGWEDLTEATTVEDKEDVDDIYDEIIKDLDFVRESAVAYKEIEDHIGTATTTINDASGDLSKLSDKQKAGLIAAINDLNAFDAADPSKDVFLKGVADLPDEVGTSYDEDDTIVDEAAFGDATYKLYEKVEGEYVEATEFTADTTYYKATEKTLAGLFDNYVSGVNEDIDELVNIGKAESSINEKYDEVYDEINDSTVLSPDQQTVLNNILEDALDNYTSFTSREAEGATVKAGATYEETTANARDGAKEKAEDFLTDAGTIATAAENLEDIDEQKTTTDNLIDIYVTEYKNSFVADNNNTNVTTTTGAEPVTYEGDGNRVIGENAATIKSTADAKKYNTSIDSLYDDTKTYSENLAAIKGALVGESATMTVEDVKATLAAAKEALGYRAEGSTPASGYYVTLEGYYDNYEAAYTEALKVKFIGAAKDGKAGELKGLYDSVCGAYTGDTKTLGELEVIFDAYVDAINKATSSQQVEEQFAKAKAALGKYMVTSMKARMLDAGGDIDQNVEFIETIYGDPANVPAVFTEAVDTLKAAITAATTTDEINEAGKAFNNAVFQTIKDDILGEDMEAGTETLIYAEANKMYTAAATITGFDDGGLTSIFDDLMLDDLRSADNLEQLLTRYQKAVRAMNELTVTLGALSKVLKAAGNESLELSTFMTPFINGFVGVKTVDALYAAIDAQVKTLLVKLGDPGSTSIEVTYGMALYNAVGYVAPADDTESEEALGMINVFVDLITNEESTVDDIVKAYIELVLPSKAG